MQIIIPMSGFGERFRRAGYAMPKPLIEVGGKPIIAHVIDMFPDEANLLFICNDEHLDNAGYRMRETLEKYCPTGRIVGIPPHKLGPIHAVRLVDELIDAKSPVIVNYCDFSCYWNWLEFKQFVSTSKCDGAIPAYKGFHPHTLGSTNYAYMLEKDGWVQDIQEKKPFTDNRMNEYASSGTYYFASGQIMKDAFRTTIGEGLDVNGEYYVSLAYKSMLRDERKVAVYPLQHFMQWGTPEDVVEFESWSTTFDTLVTSSPPNISPQGAVIIPMAGLGQRFVQEGFAKPKPLISVSGEPMVIQAVHDLPPACEHVFILREDMAGYQEISEAIKQVYPKAVLKAVPFVTEGQACTALIGLDALVSTVENLKGPITIGACDNGVIYSTQTFNELINDCGVDVIIWAVRRHANAIRNPQMFGWIDASSEGIVRHISVKKPLASPASDPIVIGTFTFKRATDFRKAVDRLIERNERINGEFYIDSCINDAISLGLRCHIFEVDSFMSWGTPNDLRTFEYWQSCFHKWKGHSYCLEKDLRIPRQALGGLEDQYRSFNLRQLCNQS
jgi:NDP-sugar pyrophosphorylase family protein